MDSLQPELIPENDFIVEDSETSAKLHDIITNIELLIPEYLATKGDDIKTLKDLSQLEYTAFLMYCRDHYIRPTKCMYKCFPGVSHKDKITYMIDDNIFYGVVEYYISLSFSNNKICNQAGINALTGFYWDTLARLENAQEQRPLASKAIKSVNNWYENALEIGAQSGKNALGYVATLNHRFKWSNPNNQTLTVNITRDKSQIMQSVDTGLLTENP